MAAFGTPNRTQNKGGSPAPATFERLGGDGVSKAPERAPALKPAWGAKWPGRDLSRSRDAHPNAQRAPFVIAIFPGLNERGVRAVRSRA